MGIVYYRQLGLNWHFKDINEILNFHVSFLCRLYH